MKIKTELLQNMVSKAIQGASFNKMIPLTSLIGILVERNITSKDKSNLILLTTDGSNQFRVTQEIDRADEFYTIVNADIFSKLVGKTTKEFITLDNKENYLEVTGNGTYKLEIAINEEGEMVKFPEIVSIQAEPYSISTKLLQEAIKVAKASVAKTMEVPCLTGYYISDNIITTDRQLICKLDYTLSKEPLLISSEMAELLLLVEEETVNVLHEENNLILFNSTFIIAGKELEGKSTYPVVQITNVTAQEYQNSIKVNQQDILNILDRMSLFVTEYDKNGIYLDFNAAGIIVRSQKSNAYETISVTDSNNVEPFNCLVDIEMLKTQIETISTDDVTIYYGQEKSIKIVDGKCTHIISLLDKENN